MILECHDVKLPFCTHTRFKYTKVPIPRDILLSRVHVKTHKWSLLLVSFAMFYGKMSMFAESKWYLSSIKMKPGNIFSFKIVLLP